MYYTMKHYFNHSFQTFQLLPYLIEFNSLITTTTIIIITTTKMITIKYLTKIEVIIKWTL